MAVENKDISGGPKDSTTDKPRSTLSLGINIDTGVLDRAMRSVEFSSVGSGSKAGALGRRVDQMSDLVRSGSRRSDNAELGVFEKSFERLRDENRIRSQSAAAAGGDSAGVAVSATAVEPEGSSHKAFGKDKSERRSGGKHRDEEASYVGSVDSPSERGHDKGKKDKARVAKLGKDGSGDADGIDVQEYEMLYGGSIVVKSASTADFSLPRKKLRSRDGNSFAARPSSSKEKEVSVYNGIQLKDLAERMSLRAPVLLKVLMGLGMAGNVNQSLDLDTAELLCSELGYKVELEQTEAERKVEMLIGTLPSATTGHTRPPVVTVMGHVDHGKTSLLDAIRNATVATGESGGITQHIGAYIVDVDTKEGRRQICFVDTPGHEAFAEMRSRGAKVTDIAALVVAADDSVMAQTVEAINHIKAAGVAMIIVANKIDKPGADLDRLKADLSKHGVVVEDYGGDVPLVPVSAVTGQGIPDLLETIVLHADIMELKANYDGIAVGTVIESKIDKHKGPVVTVLVQGGTLRVGDIVASVSGFGRIRRMTNDNGVSVSSATPSVPVELTGLNTALDSGARFVVVGSEYEATEIFDIGKKVGQGRGSSSDASRDFNFEGKKKELNVIVKSDVWGSVEAIVGLLSKIKSKEVDLNIVHKGVGMVSASDMSLIKTTGGIIFGFKVPVDERAKSKLGSGVDIRTYDVIYDLENNVKEEMLGMLELETKETKIGSAVVRKVFAVSKVGSIAGSYVSDGVIRSSSLIKVIRGGVAIGESKIASLRSVSDDVKEVAAGHECGIRLSADIPLKEGDTLEVFLVEKIRASSLL